MKLPLSVRLFTSAVAAASGLSFAGWYLLWPNGNGLEGYGGAGWLLPVTFGLLSATAVMFPLHLAPGRKLVINDVLHFAALLLFGPPLAMASVAAGSGCGYAALALRGRRGPWAVLFNPAKNALGVAAGGLVYYSMMPAHVPVGFDDPRLMLALPGTAAVMYLLNTVPTCIVAGLQHKKNVLRSWLTGRRVDALQSVALYLLGLVTALTVQEHPWAVLVMALPAAPIYVTLKRSAELLDRVQDDKTVTAVEAMADTVDLRNPFTHDSSRRVADYAERIARALSMPEKDVALIRMAARVHDLGNIGVSDQVLRKAGPLTTDEWEQVEKHVRTGYDILGGFPEYREVREIVLLHHERWDGSGYPQAIVGIQNADTYRTQLAGQVVGIADALDALQSERPYRAAMTLEEALDALRTGRGTQWNPDVADGVERVFGAVAPASIETRSMVHAAGQLA